MIWHVVELKVKPEAEDAAHYALLEAGAEGTETNALQKNLRAGQSVEPLQTLTVIGYFKRPPQIADVQREIETSWHIHQLANTKLLNLETRELENQDWLAEWKKSWQPTRAGRFIVAPSWTQVDTDDASPHVIRIEPGMAFGTGTHETTRLCLEIISRYDVPANPHGFNSLLDVGCGTGVLAIAAAKINAGARIEACDTDADSVTIARENARLNQVENLIEFHHGSIHDQTASADVVCANLTADVIAPLLPQLLSLTCGDLILSGILETQITMMQERLRECGAREREIMIQGEWTAWIV